MRNAPVWTNLTPKTVLQEIAVLVLARAGPARLCEYAAMQLKVPPQRTSFYRVKLDTELLCNAYEIMVPLSARTTARHGAPVLACIHTRSGLAAEDQSALSH